MQDGDADVACGIDWGKIFSMEEDSKRGVGTYCLGGRWVIGMSFLAGGGGILGER